MAFVKQSLRKHYHAILAKLPDDYKEQASRDITANLQKLLLTLESYSIGLYAPRDNEPDILGIRGYNPDYYCSLPRVTKSGTIEYMAWEPTTRLIKNPQFNFLEIKQGKAVMPQIICIHGLSFSLQGDRLGNGAGHFDRYIARNKKQAGQKQIYIAISFHDVLTTTLACEQHDQKCDWIITNKTIIKICN